MISSLITLMDWICESIWIHGMVFIVVIVLIAGCISYALSWLTNITIKIKHETISPSVNLKKDDTKNDE